jgi:hypothetical protein
MSKLSSGTTYIYEKADGVTYAREFNSGSTDRIVVGYDFKEEERQEDDLWKEIRKTARTNKNLAKALDKVKVLYRLSKDDPL